MIVTHDRPALLARCLAAVLSQTLPVDEIIVIDNASAVPAHGLLADEHEGSPISWWRTRHNVGGAGGFAWGLTIAHTRGHARTWLMDDDAEPDPQCHGHLTAAASTLGGDGYSFLASTVLEAPATSPGPPRTTPSPSGGVRPTDFAHFIGVLVNMDVARRTHLPVSDFFIWHDDVEYTRRLGTLAPGYACQDALMYHPRTGDRVDSRWKLEHDVRNRLWLLRFPFLVGGAPRWRYLLQTVRVVARQAMIAGDKRAWCTFLWRGLRDGLTTEPVPRHAEALIPLIGLEIVQHHTAASAT